MSAVSGTLLVVDDEFEMRALLADYFVRHGYQVEQAQDAAQARQLLTECQTELAIVDVNMPGENGLSLMRWIREAHPQVAVVLLTANADTVDRVVGLEIGADDYVNKPCELRELLARVRAVLRRARPQPLPEATPAEPAPAPAEAASEPTSMAFGERILDFQQRKLFDAAGVEIDISSAEFDLLAFFARNPNRPLTRDRIMEQAHKRGWEVFDRSIDLRVMRLRRKIESNPEKPDIIRTVRGVGYIFTVPLA